MKILVVGGGGREHAIVWSLVKSLELDILHEPNVVNSNIHKIYCAPGNAGIAQIAHCVPIQAMDIDKLFEFARNEKIDYTIVGMDDPLALGIVDKFLEGGLNIFGPSKEAAKIEWSKNYAKDFMKKYGVPTAAYECFLNFSDALEYCGNINTKYPLVVKADGLAVGKGVYICSNFREAEKALKELMIDSIFGKSGDSVVIEEFLDGVETTVMAFCDGKTLIPMVSAKDHKKAYDGEIGPNTGGMGVISPSPYYTDEIASKCEKEIFTPTLNGLINEGIVYKGIIYFGLMINSKGVFVIEYNSRFGDPEAQTVLPKLKSSLLDICLACSNGVLDKMEIKWENIKSVCVMLTSEGYPGKYEKGYPISGINDAEAKGAIVFHSATKKDENSFLTSGGRVLGVVCQGDSLKTAADKAYDAVSNIRFEKMHYRKDIGRDC